MTNPIALPKPAPQGSSNSGNNNTSTTTPAVRYYEGNIQLLEARFLQLTSSIRALHRSVEELRDFCKDSEREGQVDHVIVESVFENLGILRKQRRELTTVVDQMNELHANTDVPDDIKIMVLGDEIKETELTIAAVDESYARNDNNRDDDNGGVYL